MVIMTMISLPNEMMKRLHFPSWHFVAVNRKSHDTRLVGTGKSLSFVRPLMLRVHSEPIPVTSGATRESRPGEVT
jgi:hypothetical protein